MKINRNINRRRCCLEIVFQNYIKKLEICLLAELIYLISYLIKGNEYCFLILTLKKIIRFIALYSANGIPPSILYTAESPILSKELDKWKNRYLTYLLIPIQP